MLDSLAQFVPAGKKKKKKKSLCLSPGAFPGARRHAVRHIGTYLRRKSSRFDWFSLVTVWNSWLIVRSSKEDFVTPPLIWPPPWAPDNCSLRCSDQTQQLTKTSTENLGSPPMRCVGLYYKQSDNHPSVISKSIRIFSLPPLRKSKHQYLVEF